MKKTNTSAKFIILLLALIVIFVVVIASIKSDDKSAQTESRVDFPVSEYLNKQTKRGFGEYINDGRFVGYHSGIDVEFVDVKEETPVLALADGVVLGINSVSGYGGVIKVLHKIGKKEITTIYGHVDITSRKVEGGDEVKKGDFIANLGAHESDETDGERKHLHLAMYEGDDIRVRGYERTGEDIKKWINPNDFFQEQTPKRTFIADDEFGGDIYDFSFEIPDGHEVEYVPQTKALNIYKTKGLGSALERSSIFIRHFNAEVFLTLASVEIHSKEDLVIGKENYTARRYDIEKSDEEDEFKDQPSWRHVRHIVTDFKEKDGYSQFNVVAKNPDFDMGVYEAFLASIQVNK